MINALAQRTRQIISQNLIPSERTAFYQQLVLVSFASLAVAILDWEEVTALAIGFPVILLLVAGPSCVVVFLFLLYLLFSHQYYSPFTVHLGGIEWHPREFLLFLLLAHATYKFARGRVRLLTVASNVWVGLVGLFIVLATAVGFFRDEPPDRVIQEFRYGFFILDYFILLVLIADIQFFKSVLRLLTYATTGVAVLSLFFFAYAMFSGNKLQLNQTPLGEFMQYPFGPTTIQMIRPNGHILFEIGIVVCVSILLSREIKKRQRVLFSALGCILAAAHIITFMRTAYIAVGISLCVLALLLIQQNRLRIALLGTSGFAGLLTVIWVLNSYELSLSGHVDSLELSLRGRAIEILGALDAIGKHVIFGTGFGSTFEALGLVQSGDQLAASTTQYQMIHDVWLYYLLKGGVVGFLCASSGLLGIWFVGYATMRQLPVSFDRLIVRGLVAAYAGQLVAAFAMPRLLYPQGYTLVALFAVAFTVYARATINSEVSGGQSVCTQSI